MTKKEVVQILALLQSAFPNTRIEPESTANLWYGLYQSEDFEAAKKATELIIRTNKYFPSHLEFRKALVACRTEEKKPAELPEHTQKSIQAKIDAIMEMMKDSY